jgi:hypothetical protein
MKRQAFSIIATFSLLLLISVVVLWVRSYGTRDQYSQSSGASVQAYVSDRGGLGYKEFTLGTPGPAWEWNHDTMPVQGEATLRQETPRWQRLLGVEWRDGSGTLTGMSYREKGWRVAYRTPALLLAVLPAIWLVRSAREQLRGNRMRCTQCGCDMGGTAERCPECSAASGASGETTTPRA